MLIALEEGEKYSLSLYSGAGRLRDARQHSWEYPGKTVTTSCINYLIILHFLLPANLFVCLHGVDPAWCSQFNQPSQGNEMVKDHPSISSGLEGISAHCNAESCQKQGEGPRWEGRRGQRECVGDVQSGHGVWDKLLVG